MKCLLSAVFFAVSSLFAQEPPGLVAKFRMDGVCGMLDETAGPAHGVMVDMLAAPNVHHMANTALSFTTNSSYISLGASEKIRLEQDRSISFWIKPELGGDRTGTIFMYGNGMLIGYEEKTGNVRLRIHFDGSFFYQLSLLAGEWQAVTITFEKNYTELNSRAVVYLNGIQVDGIEKTKSAPDYTNAIALMGPSNQTPPMVNGFRGSLDEFKIFNRSLSAVEVINAILPATLSFFKAGRTQDAVELQWKTLSEENVSHYIIQESEDGVYFTDLGRVDANRFHYWFYDENESEGPGWYRLAIVDRDGRRMFSTIVRVGPKEGGSRAISFFPNPASGILQFSGLLDNYTALLIDASGVIAMRQQLRNGKIDVGALKAGLYHIIVYDQKGIQKFISKIIKR